MDKKYKEVELKKQFQEIKRRGRVRALEDEIKRIKLVKKMRRKQ